MSKARIQTFEKIDLYMRLKNIVMRRERQHPPP